MFEKATKQKCKLRCAIFGPSGSGKTFTALRMAKGIGGKIAVIDSEFRSARKYSDRFDFQVAELSDFSIDGYVRAIDAAAAIGIDVLIIDSLSHGWQELVAEVEKLAQAKYRGNTWSAWSEGTPKQRKFVQAILRFPGHVIATMRSATEWQTSADEKGRSRPVRIGLKPEQGKGIEYEFDQLMELSAEHMALIIKDRTGKYQDKYIEKPGEEFGKELADWLADGSDAPSNPIPASAIEPKPATAQQEQPVQLAKKPADISRLNALIMEMEIPQETVRKWHAHFKVASLFNLTQEQADSIVAKLEKSKATKAA